MGRRLAVAFIHPDLGIGGAERLVVDAAVGLQKLGNIVSIHTSHHDPSHSFEETNNGTLHVVHYKPPFFLPRSIHGKFHIIFAHLRQLHLTWHLIRNLPEDKDTSTPSGENNIDVFFVDQLSTCIPLLRWFTRKRVVFYCHFPDKLLAEGEFIDENDKEQNTNSSRSLSKGRKKAGLLKRLYRMPMDWLEEKTTGNADLILANSRFTSRIFSRHFPSINVEPVVIYPGINVNAYETTSMNNLDADAVALTSDRPTFISLNRFEAKKNVALAIKAFAAFLKLEAETSNPNTLRNSRLVIAGGYDPRLKDNIETMDSLLHLIDSLQLTYHLLPGSKPIPSGLLPSKISSPTALELAQVIILPNFSTSQRSVLLTSPSTLSLLYTPNNEHFGIGPVEGMLCGLPVLACDSGGPKESVVDDEAAEPNHITRAKQSKGTGWLRPPDVQAWAKAMYSIAHLTSETRHGISMRAKSRAQSHFSMETMASDLDSALEKAYDMGKVVTWRDRQRRQIRSLGLHRLWMYTLCFVASWALFGLVSTSYLVWASALYLFILGSE